MNDLLLDSRRAMGSSRTAWAQAFDLLAVEPPCRAIGLIEEGTRTATGEALIAWIALGDCIAAVLCGGGMEN